MTLALPRAELTDTSLTMPADATYEEWQEQGARLFTMERSVMWWIGDWWRFGEHQYGDRAEQAAPTGYSVETLRAAAWVASQVEPVRRRTLSWSHHREVAALPSTEQDYWLGEAEGGEWSRNELRARLKRGTTDEPVIEEANAVVSEVIRAVERLDDLRAQVSADAVHGDLQVRSRAAFARRLRLVGTYLGQIAFAIEEEDSRGRISAA